MPYEIPITKDEAGVSPKNFLKKTLEVNYTDLLKYIKSKRITLNKKKIKKDDILQEGDIIKVWLDSIKKREVKKKHTKEQNLHIPIIYENGDFIVFDKLPGIVVQGAQHSDTSLSLHLAYLQNKLEKDIDFEYMHVHRLDKETSGLLVVAKNKISLRDLNKIFRNKEVKKVYWCLCVGNIENKADEIKLYLKRNPENSREKVGIYSKDDLEVKETHSKYKVIEEFSYQQQVYSLVEVEIITGFMHQIRVHMKHLGTPILGDSMYGNMYINNLFSDVLQRQFLHAKTIEFPYKQKDYFFEAPLHKDLQEALFLLKRRT